MKFVCMNIKVIIRIRRRRSGRWTRRGGCTRGTSGTWTRRMKCSLWRGWRSWSNTKDFMLPRLNSKLCSSLIPLFLTLLLCREFIHSRISNLQSPISIFFFLYIYISQIKVIKTENHIYPACCSMADEAAGEVPVAFVVRVKGSNISEQQIKKYIATQVPINIIGIQLLII